MSDHHKPEPVIDPVKRWTQLFIAFALLLIVFQALK
ncbi:Uncharacterised protein [uncultured archaeon]|nr:Uncharacterised protein [uncultured archaeon]